MGLLLLAVAIYLELERYFCYYLTGLPYEL